MADSGSQSEFFEVLIVLDIRINRLSDHLSPFRSKFLAPFVVFDIIALKLLLLSGIPVSFIQEKCTNRERELKVTYVQTRL